MLTQSKLFFISISRKMSLSCSTFKTKYFNIEHYHASHSNTWWLAFALLKNETSKLYSYHKEFPYFDIFLVKNIIMIKFISATKIYLNKLIMWYGDIAFVFKTFMNDYYKYVYENTNRTYFGIFWSTHMVEMVSK